MKNALRVGVVGIGRVGLPFAAVCSKFYDTVGIDASPSVVKNVNLRVRFSEPKLNGYLEEFGLRASTDFRSLASQDIVVLSVGSQASGSGYSSRNLISALDQVSPYLTSKNQVLVILTTLPPVSIAKELFPYFEKHQTLDRIAGICYNPTMIALGNAVDGFENPDYVLIGESNVQSGDLVESFWQGIVSEDIPIFRSSITNIALAKYALNTALTLKITLLNTITELSEKLGGDIDILSEILKTDPRIGGPKMFKGGLGYGGTCFPVDVDALRSECEELGIPTTLADAVQSINDRQVERSIHLIESYGKKSVSILGATYRPDTSVVVASQSLQIAERLADHGYEVMIYDPMGIEGAKAQLGEKVVYSTDLHKALSFGNIVFLGVEWPEFRELGKESFRNNQIVIDPWRMLRSKDLECTYLGYGLAKQ